MTFSWSPKAADIARQAHESADRAERGVAAINIRLDNFVAEQSRSWGQLNETIRRQDEGRAADQRDWRSELGKRLDKQDNQMTLISRWQWGVAGGVVLVLLSVVGFFLAHLPVFK